MTPALTSILSQVETCSPAELAGVIGPLETDDRFKALSEAELAVRRAVATGTLQPQSSKAA